MKILEWARLSEAERSALLDRAVSATADNVASTVKRIIRQVRADGDATLRALTRRFDGVELDSLKVGPETIAFAANRADPATCAALERAAGRIEAFHRAGIATDYWIETAPGMRCGRLSRPIEPVGLYVPGGHTALPSTLLMLAIPARLAGCEEVVLCSPPAADGELDPTLAAACRVAGIDHLYPVGGAQAIAAMAFGTATIPACAKLFGPGNAFVTEAKQQVSRLRGGPAIDMPAGPSEVLVIADAAASPAQIAADCLAQCEHGPDSQALVLSPCANLLKAVIAEIGQQLDSLPRRRIAEASIANSRFVLTASIAQAIEISNRYAPEHLMLALSDAADRLASVSAAGSVFIGPLTAESLGDYGSGTNHVLPTDGHARVQGGLSVASFQRHMTVQEADARALNSVGQDAVLLARAEGLEGHARAVLIRRPADDLRSADQTPIVADSAA